MDLLFKTFVVLVISQIAWGLNEESVKELRCFKPDVAKHVDFQWVMSVDKWYAPKFSKLDLYRSVSKLGGAGMEDIQEDELYYNACLSMSWKPDAVKLSGFNGKSLVFPISVIGENVFQFTVGDNPKEMEKGTTYITLTDNQTFIVFSTCWGDDEMSWGVLSTTKSLSEKANRDIEKHLIALGYQKKYFTSLKYDSCNKKVGKEEL